MITFLLVLVVCLLVLISRGLWTLNENLRHFGRETINNTSSQILLLRGNNVRVDESTEQLKKLVRQTGMKV